MKRRTGRLLSVAAVAATLGAHRGFAADTIIDQIGYQGTSGGGIYPLYDTGSWFDPDIWLGNIVPGSTPGELDDAVLGAASSVTNNNFAHDPHYLYIGNFEKVGPTSQSLITGDAATPDIITVKSSSWTFDFSTGSAPTATITPPPLTGSLTATSVVIGDAATDNAALTLLNGTASFATATIGNQAQSTGSLTLSSGQLNVVTGAATESVGLSGNGTFNQSNGSNTCALFTLGTNAGATGSLTLSGGALNVATVEYVGFSGSGVVIQSGGSNTVGGNPAGTLGFQMATNTGSTASYFLSNGTLQSSRDEIVAEHGTATFVQSGGTNTCLAIIVVGHQPDSLGSYTLTSGTLTTQGLAISDTPNSTGIFDLSGTGILIDPLAEGAGSNGNGNTGTVGDFYQSGGSNSTGNFTIGNTKNSIGLYDLTGGSFTTTGSLALIGVHSTFNATGGTATFASVVNGGALTIGAGSNTSGHIAVTGTYTQSTGSSVVAGSLAVAGGITLNGGTFQIGSAGLVGSVTGNIVDNAGLTIAAGTSATPTILTNITGHGSLIIGSAQSTAYLQLATGAEPSVLSSLTINSGSTLDISNNPLAINYPAGNDPVATIRGELVTAYNGGNWQGTGLTSSLARGKPAAFAIGYKDNPATDQIQIQATVPGDCDLSGTTDFSDLTTVAQFFGQSTADGNAVSWQTGDVNYDGSVDFSDLTIVAQYFGDSLTKAEAAELPASFVAQYDLALAQLGKTSPIPEPRAITLLTLITAALLLPRRRLRRP